MRSTLPKHSQESVKFVDSTVKWKLLGKTESEGEDDDHVSREREEEKRGKRRLSML